MGNEIAALEISDASLHEVQRIAHMGYGERDNPIKTGQYPNKTSRILTYEPCTYDPNNQSFSKWVHPGDVQEVKFRFGDLEQIGTLFDITLRIVRPDGSVRTHHFRRRRDRCHPMIQNP